MKMIASACWSRMARIWDAVNTDLYGDNQFLCLDFLKADEEPAAFVTNGFYSASDFIELGERIGVKARYLKKFCDKFKKLEGEMLALVDASFLDIEQKEAYKSVLQ